MPSTLPDPVTTTSSTATPATTARDAFVAGVREMLTSTPGVFAWGLVTGVAMVKSGLTVFEATMLSLFAYAGSAQLASLPLIAVGAPIWLIFLTAVTVNLRFVVYSVIARPHLAHLPMRERLWFGSFMADIMFIKFNAHVDRFPNHPYRERYFFGGGSANWVIWQVSSIIGIVAATTIPTSWGLELAGTLTLIALIVPLCKQRPVLAGVLASGVTSIVAHSLPMRLGLLLGIIVGVIAAFTAERLSQGASSQDAA